MTALKIGLNWRLHDGEVRRKWKLVGNDAEEIELVKDVQFVTQSDMASFSSRGSVAQPLPKFLLRNWFGESATKMEDKAFMFLGFEDRDRVIELHFTDTTVQLKIDPTYDIDMQEDDALINIETLILPLVEAKRIRLSRGNVRTVLLFSIPRILVYDFVFSLMRMGGPELHCNRADLKNAVEEFLKK